MTITARLFDASGKDEEIELPEKVGKLASDKLLWIDLGRDRRELEQVSQALGLELALDRLEDPTPRPQVIEREHLVRFRVTGMQKETKSPTPVVLDLIAAHNVVLSVHTEPIEGLELPIEVSEGETRYGKLEAAAFVALLLDGMLTGYFRAVEGVERRIDALDEHALRVREPDQILGALVSLRREIAVLRRALAPQREVFYALERPEMELQTEVGTPWPVVVDRFRQAMEALELARDALVGNFDIVMTRTGQRTNDVMRVLTVISSVLLPSVVVAGIMGMNFKAGLFDDPTNFYIVIAAMITLAVLILLFAKVKRWI